MFPPPPPPPPPPPTAAPPLPPPPPPPAVAVAPFTETEVYEYSRGDVGRMLLDAAFSDALPRKVEEETEDANEYPDDEEVAPSKLRASSLSKIHSAAFKAFKS